MTAAAILAAGAETEPAACAFCCAVEVARPGECCSEACAELYAKEFEPDPTCADELLALEADFRSAQEA